MEDGRRSRREGGAEERMRLQTDSSPLTPSTSHAVAQQRYNEAQELEKQLRVLIPTKGPSDPNIRALRHAIREAYEVVLLEDHAFAEEHEVESALWRLHYKCIDEFRNRIRKTVQAAAAAATAPAIPMPGAKVTPRKEPVFKVLSVFKSFLSESTGFYHDLILKIRTKHGLTSDYSSFSREEHGVAESEERVAEVKRVEQSCHRCLIFLGDLARYKEQYGESDAKAHDWSVAAGYYLQAAAFWPGGGNPHNQLAVLSTYVGDELLAVYRYFRSLAVETPFFTARDNLILLFEKNRQLYTQLTPNAQDSKVSLGKLDAPRSVDKAKDVKGDRMLSVGDGPLKLAVKDRKQDSASPPSLSKVSEVRKNFRIRFVRLNGILFTRTSLETFSEVYAATVRDLEQLLGPDDASLEAGLGSEHRSGIGTGSAGAAGVLQLISILVFTVHNVNWGPENHHPTYAEILQRSALNKHAVTAAFECAGRLMRRCGETLDVSESPLLPAMLVFMEWLACKPDMAQGSEIDDKQASARNFFWRQCVAVLNHVSLAVKSHANPGGSLEGGLSSLGGYADHESSGAMPLWEDYELRGFTPLAPAQVFLDFSQRPPRAGLGDKKEKYIRLQRVLAAGKAVAAALEDSGKGICFDEDSEQFFMPGERPDKVVKELKESVDVVANGTQGHAEDSGGPFNAPKEVKSTSSDTWVKPLASESEISPAAEVVALRALEGEEDEELIVFKPVAKERPYSSLPGATPWMGNHSMSETSEHVTSNTYSGQVVKMLGQNSTEGAEFALETSNVTTGMATTTTPPPIASQQLHTPNVVGTACETLRPDTIVPQPTVGVTSAAAPLTTGPMSTGPIGTASSAMNWLSQIGGAADGYTSPSFGWSVANSRSMFDGVSVDKSSIAGVIGPPKPVTSSWSSELEALATSGMSGFRHSISRYGLENGVPGTSSLSIDMPVKPAVSAPGSMQSASVPTSNGLYATGQSVKSAQNGIGPVYGSFLPAVVGKAAHPYLEVELEKLNISGASRAVGAATSGTSRSVHVTPVVSASVSNTGSTSWSNKDVTGTTWVGPSGIRPPPGFGPLPSKPSFSHSSDAQTVMKPRTPPGPGNEGEEQVIDDYAWLDDYSNAKIKKNPVQSGFQGSTSSLYSSDYGIWSSGGTPRSEAAAYSYHGMAVPHHQQANQQYQYEARGSYDEKVQQQLLQRQNLYDNQKSYPAEQHYQQQAQYEAAQKKHQQQLLLLQQQQLERQKQQVWYGQYHSRDPFVS